MYLHRTRRRSGFTLVELIVAAGLTILIMSVLATGFQVGLQSLSQLKSAGDLADRIRTAETMLRLDLDAQHFDTGTFLQSVAPAQPTPLASSNPGIIRVSDLRFDQGSQILPSGGFFQIRQTASVAEGLDQDGLSSTMATTHGVSMTVRRTGKTQADYFQAPLANVTAGSITNLMNSNPTDIILGNPSPPIFASQWAEVHWFLDTGRPPIFQNGVPTFQLCRRVRLLTTQNPVNWDPTFADIVSGPNVSTSKTNNLSSIMTPANRLGSGGTPQSLLVSGSALQGDDIVITNVVSFEVKPTWQSATSLPRVNANGGFNGDYPYDDLPGIAGGVFDTANGNLNQIRVTGVQIKIRVYDAKNQLTRQSVVTSKL